MDADVPLHPEELLQADESTEGKRLRVKNQVHVGGLGTGESSRLAQGMWTLGLSTNASRRTSRTTHGGALRDFQFICRVETKWKKQRIRRRLQFAASECTTTRGLTGCGRGIRTCRCAYGIHVSDVVRELCDNDSLCVGEQDIFDRLFGLAR